MTAPELIAPIWQLACTVAAWHLILAMRGLAEWARAATETQREWQIFLKKMNEGR